MKPNPITIEPVNLPEVATVLQTLTSLLERLRTSGQRLLLNLRAPRNQCRQIAAALLDAGNGWLFSDDPDWPMAIAPGKAQQQLGQETDCVIYDGFSGLQLDVLCMLAGSLRGGGLMLLLTPEQIDNHSDRYGRWQGRTPQEDYFMRYFFDHLEKENWILSACDADPVLPSIDLPKTESPALTGELTAQQAEVFAKMQQWWAQISPPMLILTADRGRGKSTLLGHFAHSIEADADCVITAASRSQAEILLQQIRPEMQARFVAPDQFICQQQAVDCLIIDEAATLPVSLLLQCLPLANKILMATTTGGYEGTGGGFLHKFIARLDPSRFQQLSLSQPIRWGQGDLLEAWMNRVLMLKPEMNTSPPDVSSLSIYEVSKSELAKNQALLESVYGLLVSAHYRTRPSDLRQLMEDEQQRLIVAMAQAKVVGVLLLNREGGFDTELAQEVFMGRRRPQGHLLAQMMTAQAGIADFSCLQGLRVQRIAVLPALRRQGIGSRLLTQARQLALELHCDYLGSSFAADAAVLPFWRESEFQLVHISAGKGTSSAQQTVIVLQALNERVESIMVGQRQVFQKYLPVWLMSYCRDMPPVEVLEILRLLSLRFQMLESELKILQAFAQGYRGFEYTQAQLQVWLIGLLPSLRLSEAENQLLVEKVLQNRNGYLSGQAGGKKNLLKKIRHCVEKLLDEDER